MSITRRPYLMATPRHAMPLSKQDTRWRLVGLTLTLLGLLAVCAIVLWWLS